MLQVENLSFRIAGKEIIEETSFTYPRENGLVLIIGENGVGKSTLAMILAGLLKPTTGTVKLNGRDIFEDLKWTRERVKLLLQDIESQLITDRVWDEIAISLANLGKPRNLAYSKAEQILQKLGIWDYRFSNTDSLSYGLKQRVVLASLLVTEPYLLILDEPDAYLDLEGRLHLGELVSELSSRLIVFWVTHDIIELALIDAIPQVDGIIAGFPEPKLLSPKILEEFIRELVKIK